MSIPVSSTRDGAGFAVRVVPRAGRTTIAGARAGALLVRLAAPPVDGAANDALIACLAGAFDCPPRNVTITGGHTSRNKRVAISGLTPESVAARLDSLCAPPDPEPASSRPH